MSNFGEDIPHNLLLSTTDALLFGKTKSTHYSLTHCLGAKLFLVTKKLVIAEQFIITVLLDATSIFWCETKIVECVVLPRSF